MNTDTAARVAAAQAAQAALSHINPILASTTVADRRALNSARREVILAEQAHRAAR